MNNRNVFGDETEETAIQRAMKKALEKAGVLNENEEVSQEEQSSVDLKASLAQLQTELSRFSDLPTTVEEIKAYDQDLQKTAWQIATKVLEIETFLASVTEAGLLEEPAFKEQVTKAKEYLGQIEERPALRRYVFQAKAFLGLSKIRGFRELTEALQSLADKGLAFKTKRNPKIPLSPEAILTRENGEEFIYLPNRKSGISQLAWDEVKNVRDRIQETEEERREAIKEALQSFKSQATPGLSVYKAVHEGGKGILFLSTFFEDRKKGHKRLGRMLVETSRGNFTIWKVFEPDRIEFILGASRWWNRDGTINWDNPRWFPLDPSIFGKRQEEGKIPQIIAEIVWPVLRDWYENEKRQRDFLAKSEGILARSEISPVELLAGIPGFCAFRVGKAQTARRKDDLTLALRGNGRGTFVLEEYISLNDVFDFKDLLKSRFEVSIEEEEETEVSEEWQLAVTQGRIVRSFLKLAADRQLSAEIQAKQEVLESLVTVTEGLDEGKRGHSIFHIPRAQTESRGPAHLTCHIEWQEGGFVLQEYHSWVEPWVRSRGVIDLQEALGNLISRQPVEDEKPVVQVLRHLLNTRRAYEAWKVSQEIPEEEEGENGPPSDNNPLRP